MATTAPQTGYAPVNGLQMYYEIHGEKRSDQPPLVLLHGAYMTIDGFGQLLAELAKARQVIGIELQAHGHTGDIDRPLSYESMADDTAGVIRHLGIGQVDVFGYSMGGGAALQVAIRHPELVHKLIVMSAGYRYDGGHPVMYEMIDTITPEMFAGSPFEEAYMRTAPDPDAFPTLVDKLKELDRTPFAWPDEDVRKISAPTLIIVGDSDAVMLEHAVQMFKLLGGGVMGDLSGLPKSQLAILPGTTHFIPFGSGMLDRVDWILSMAGKFLDAPLPEGK